MSLRKYNNPDVSVIIPVYNAEKYMEQCLGSLLVQTHKNFEIICVDDGSEDQTVSLIRRMMAEDDRIQLLELPHEGKAGVMRNRGLERAVGEYCLFLDADDFFEPVLIEHSLKRIREDQADVCLFDARLYYEETRSFVNMGHILKKEYVPKKIPFEGKSFPYVMNIGPGFPWTKLFRRSFILENNLEFMSLRRFNDLYFVYTAMALAKRITILEETLVNYRRSENSLQTATEKSPWDWFMAAEAVKNRLTEAGIYADVEISFKNFMIDGAFYALGSVKTAESFSAIYNKMKNDILPTYDLMDFPGEHCYSYNKKRYELYLNMMKYDEKEYLFQEGRMLKAENLELFNRVRTAEQDAKKNVVYKTAKALWTTMRRIMRNH